MDDDSATTLRSRASQPVLTTSNGCPVMRPKQSQREHGNLLLKDFALLDLLSHFNRERIPERVVHAKGSGAYGEFEVTHDISDICDIDMLLGFPGLIHAQKRDPRTGLPNAAAFWDWVTQNHESLHMIMWLYSEYGTFRDHRHMNSYMRHAHKWEMPDGTFRYVHMYLQADAGYEFAGESEMQSLRGADPDHASRDLFNAIDQDDYPTWTAYVQVVDSRDCPEFGYNLLDLTKHWDMGTYPQNLGTVPSRPFGKLTLNRNPENFFAEIEQLAFSPSHLVPGIVPSEDPMLQARMLAYPDAQRYRLGVNYQQIPVNQPLCPFNPLLRDGTASTDGNHGSRAGYISNHVKPLAKPRRQPPPDSRRDAWLDALITQPLDSIGEVNCVFPRTFWTHLDDPQYEGWQDKMVSNLSISIAQAPSDIRQRVYKVFRLVHTDLAIRVQETTENLVNALDMGSQSMPLSKL